MKIVQYLLNRIIAPLIVGLLLFIITGILSTINTGNWWQFFGRLPISVWIIIVLVILIWIIIITYRKKIANLESVNINLKKKLKADDELIYKENAYWNEATSEGPYCSRCLQKDDIRITMHPISGTEDMWKCPECKTCIHSKRHSSRRTSRPSRDPNAW